MLIAKHPLTTRTLGKSQGYLGLPVVDIVYPNGERAMRTYWTPTPDELAALNAGANIQLEVLGDGHPPVMMTVSDAPSG